MSKIIEAMEKAKLLREKGGTSTDESALPKKTISWLIVINILGMLIVFIIFYVFLKDNKTQELNLISDRLGQVENKLTQLVDSQNIIKAPIASLNQSAPAVSPATAIIPEKTTSVIKQTTEVHKKEITKPVKKYHVVKIGETLYSISKRYGKSVDEIRRVNSLKQNQPIKQGQKLIVVQMQQ